MNDSRTSNITEMDKILYINPDCPMKILLDHIRKSIGIDPIKEFDLCTMNGELKNILTYEDCLYATNVLEPFANYICVLIERAEDGSFTKIIPLISKNSDISLKLRRYVNPSKRFSYDSKQKSRNSINRSNRSNRSTTSRSYKSDISFQPSKIRTNK